MKRFAFWPDVPGRWLALAAALLGGAVAVMNAQIQSTKAPAKTETATIGGGCFWCAEAVFQRIPGVKSVVSGFAGGTVPNPTYQQVCSGTTGHAEVIQLTYDPSVLSYEKVLEIFWEAHDPTTLNRQGNDVGTQYRSIILYSNEEQKKAAEASKASAAKRFKAPIVTEVVPLKAFYSAEAYHQDYYNQHTNDGAYCTFVITPHLQQLIQEGVIPQRKK
jgi:peptide-methionine (S)-S-oxide reductase